MFALFALRRTHSTRRGPMEEAVPGPHRHPLRSLHPHPHLRRYLAHPSARAPPHAKDIHDKR